MKFSESHISNNSDVVFSRHFHARKTIKNVEHGMGIKSMFVNASTDLRGNYDNCRPTSPTTHFELRGNVHDLTFELPYSNTGELKATLGKIYDLQLDETISPMFQMRLSRHICKNMSDKSYSLFS